MKQLNIIYKQIKINSKLFILVNIIFLIILILFSNFSENKKVNKYNFKITLEYDKTLSNINRFDITSFSSKELFKNFKKKEIYLEKQTFLPQKDTYYLFIIDEDFNSANEIFEENIKDFKTSFYKKINVIINLLQNENKKLHSENMMRKEKNKELICPSLIKREIEICNLINANQIKIFENLDKISRYKLEIFNYKFLNEGKNINISILDKEYKLFLIIYLFLILNFLIIFNQKTIYHKV